MATFTAKSFPQTFLRVAGMGLANFFIKRKFSRIRYVAASVVTDDTQKQNTLAHALRVINHAKNLTTSPFRLW